MNPPGVVKTSGQLSYEAYATVVGGVPWERLPSRKRKGWEVAASADTRAMYDVQVLQPLMEEMRAKGQLAGTGFTDQDADTLGDIFNATRAEAPG